VSLVEISTADLKKLRDLAAGHALPCPLTEASLRANGFGSIASACAEALAFDSESALVRALDLLVDERVRAERPPLELVWTGPDSDAPQTRDTAIVLAELFERAQRRVMVAGYVFSQAATILRPLHAALLRGVEVRFFLHLEGPAPSEETLPAFAEQRVAEFVAKHWKFGPPYPAFFYDPRTLRPGPDVYIHAKCAVVDSRYALVTSANFTGPGQTRHIEVGVLIDDVRFAGRLEGHFNALVGQGDLVPAPFPPKAQP
jgi:phosphatidylserine/phosphatidylglycerophosphate/cardiolipin synthase-like enzyme